jgi:hypothetical protein
MKVVKRVVDYPSGFQVFPFNGDVAARAGFSAWARLAVLSLKASSLDSFRSCVLCCAP